MTRTGRTRLSRVLERAFLFLGLLGVLAWAGSEAVSAIWQDWGGWVLDREVAGKTVNIADYLADRGDALKQRMEEWIGAAAPRRATATVQPRSVTPPTLSKRAPFIGPDGLVGRVTIPRLSLSAIVREGTSGKTLSIAAGHIPGTAFPGPSGNTAIAGHRDTLFRGLKDIKNGDVIDFETLQGQFEYEVESTEIVTPKDVEVLNPGPHPQLTLVTCYPFYYVGNAPKRFIVKARLMSEAQPEPGVIREVALQAQRPAPPKPSQPLVERNHGPRKLSFTIPVHHSRQLTPGISLGITDANVEGGGVYGWMWLMPDRRTIWLHDRGIDDPLIFSSGPGGERAELTITKIGEESVSGYVVLPEQKPEQQ
ncbi:MAG: class D sortase [Bryobacterales bacterium]|nr:class D sortase [Bryobacterales bacterium]MBV9399911.1 class D sortase [Bryobacterales bacterium]